MSDTPKPEQVFIEESEFSSNLAGVWPERRFVGDTQYIRFDKYESLQADNQAKDERIAELEAMTPCPTCSSAAGCIRCLGTGFLKAQQKTPTTRTKGD